MALLVDTFTAAQRAAAGIGSSPRINGGRSATPTRFNSSVGSTGSSGGASWGDGGESREPRSMAGPKGVRVGNIAGQQVANPTPKQYEAPRVTTPAAPKLYDRNNFSDLAPAFAQSASQTALDRAGIQSSFVNLMNGQNARNQGFANSEAAYKNQLAGQLANANLDIQGFDIQQANFPQWYKFLQDQLDIKTMATIGDLDFNAKQQVNSANLRLIDWKEIQQGRKEVGQQADNATRDATSAATVSGVIQGAKQDFHDIDQQEGNALYGLDMQDERSKLSEKQRREELSNRRQQLMADFDMYKSSNAEQNAKLREREQLLGIEAQKARLQPRLLQDAMQVTLSNLGLDKAMSTGQFLEGLNGLGAQDRAAIDAEIARNAEIARAFTTWTSNSPGAHTTGFKNPNAGKPQTWNRAGFR